MNKARKMFEEELKAFEACTDEEMTALFKREKNDSEALNRFLSHLSSRFSRILSGSFSCRDVSGSLAKMHADHAGILRNRADLRTAGYGP